jgi:hypothetical protein
VNDENTDCCNHDESFSPLHRNCGAADKGELSTKAFGVVGVSALQDGDIFLFNQRTPFLMMHSSGKARAFGEGAARLETTWHGTGTTQQDSHRDKPTNQFNTSNRKKGILENMDPGLKGKKETEPESLNNLTAECNERVRVGREMKKIKKGFPTTLSFWMNLMTCRCLEVKISLSRRKPTRRHQWSSRQRHQSRSRVERRRV